ncbi:putative secreted protein (type I secretion substrate) [Vibrio sp. ES.051]|uniref:Calx-beta domain-containing protein n=1 Tax=Vibrio sp. ES.051 TaxID=1761909 RepID=UPI000C001B06|nr:Calx-beta domain-containing protein [Vibrio sp. ES.051]PFG56202.1 putative secreted protein (type I secretion substrate) [Vibrio sp. ES.051]
MDRLTLSSLMGNIVVIGLDGEIRILEEGQLPQPGELIIEEVSDTSELVIEQVTPQGSAINVTDDITALIEAIASGEDPTQLGEEFETAAGENIGSSPQTTGAVDRTGAESLASTNFETSGIDGIGLSSTQALSLLEYIQARNAPLPETNFVQDISNPVVNEGNRVFFDITLSQPIQDNTNINFSLSDDSATGGSSDQVGVDYIDDTVLVTFSDGLTEEVQVDENGAFTVSIPSGESTFTVSLDSVDDSVLEGPETFTLSGSTDEQNTPVLGTATIVDDGNGPGEDPDDDRPMVSISDAGTINEGETANFKVTLSNASEAEVQVELGLNLGDTEAGDLGTLEYNTGSGWTTVPVSGLVTVPAGLTEFDVRIASIDDEVYEGAENFSVDVTGVGAVQGSDTGTATIVDDGNGPGSDPDDDRPMVSISDAGTINEGETANFVVSLTNASEAEVQVELGLNLGDTEAGDLGTLEYNTGSGWTTVPVSGLVTVPAGLTEFDVRIASIDDEVYEGAENFSVDVTGVGAVQGSDTGTATIVDDGSGPGSDPDDDRPMVSISDAGTINEGETANFVVSLTNASEAEVQVELGLNLGDTEAGDLGTLEYNTGSGWTTVPVSGLVTVPAGLTEFDVRIASIDDEVYEGAENFSVDVTGVGAVQGSDTGTATIVDDGSGPGSDPDDDRPMVSISDAGTINEGETANFVVSLTNASEAEVQVELGLNLGDTEAGDLGTLEYNTGSGWTTVPVSGLVTVPAGLTEFDVRIASIDDEVYEGAENFSVDVTGVGAVQGSDTGTATIVDDGNGPGSDPDDDRPMVSISDAGTINEGETANFKVTLSNASEAEVQVELGLNLGDTEAGDLGTLEYNTGSGWTTVPVSGLVTVPAGLTEFDVRIASIDDEVYEGAENFSVDVTGVGAVQGSDTGTATIVDDGNGPGSDPDDDRPMVSISDAGTINEGETANFVVSLTNASEAEVQVELGLNLGDTEAGDLGTLEYNTGSGWTTVPVSGLVTVPAGLTEFDVRIASIDDEVYEGAENFSVDVTGVGAVQGSDTGTGTATIVDDGSGPGSDPDDDRPMVSISDAGTINEGETANFVVSLTNASEAEVQVELGLNLGDTEAGDLGTLEYNTGSGWTTVPVSGLVTVPAGLTEFDVRIASIDDEVYEGAENFSVDVTGVGAVQGSDTGTATIVDDGNGPGSDPDDDRPMVSISDAGTINEGETANFKVTLSNASEAEVQVELGLNLGDTEAGDLGSLEYNTGSGWTTVPASGLVTVPAGLTEFDVRIDTVNDAIFEQDEDFSVSVVGVGPVSGSDLGNATIIDDDAPPTISDVIDVVVSEEGLTNGIPDNTGSPTDTVNAASFSGTFTVGDPDTANVSVVLSGPNTLTSGGEPVSWVWNSNNQTLTASTASLAVVATVVLTEPAVSGQGSWDYTVTLFEPLDHPVNDVEDIIDFDLQISVSDGQSTTSESLNIVVEDDRPLVPNNVQAVDVTNLNIPDVITGQVSFIGNGSDSFSRSFGDVVVTAEGFLSDESVTLGAAQINQSSDGIGVKSSGDNGFPLDNEIDYRFANEQGVSEKLIIDLGDKVAFGAEIEFAKMFGGELEEGLASFYRDGVLIAQQTFSSDAQSGDFAANFSVQQGGFDQIILEATGNGNASNIEDNSDFTVRAITFIGSDGGTPIASAEGTISSTYGADGPGTTVLTGAESGLKTADGDDITVSVDPQNLNRLVGSTDNVVAFEVQFTPSTGKWEFVQYEPLSKPIGDGYIDFGYTVTDADGDSVSGSFAVNPAIPPTISGVALSVSEEGLSDANVDSAALAGFTDTTDSINDTDTLNLGSTVESVTLGLPTALISSGGDTLVWTLSNSDKILTGSASGQPIIEVSVDDLGNLSAELLGKVDHPDGGGEDVIDLEVPVIASNAFGVTSSATATVAIEDDSPFAEMVVEDVNAMQTTGSNVQLILDVSGSMGWDSVTGSSFNVVTSRLDVLKSASIALLLEYQLLGDTKVQITTFSSNANILGESGNESSDNSLPNDLTTIWMDVDQAIDLINGLTAGGGTDYDDAIALAVEDDVWGNVELLEDANNLSYFLSDGNPNSPGNQINATEQADWEAQLEQYNVTGLAYGIGSGASTQFLEPVAYDANNPIDKQISPIIVPDINSLPAILIQSVVTPITGALGSSGMGGSTSFFGADGGYVSSFNYGGATGITVMFDGTTITVDDGANNTGATAIVDIVEETVTLVVDSQNSVVIDLNTGEYTFFASSIAVATQFDFDYVLTDGDGDTIVETVSFDLEPNSVEAVDDAASTPEGTPIVVDVLSNDTNNDNAATLTLADAVVDSSKGQVLIVDNQLVFIPSNNLDDGDSARISYRTESSNGDFDIGALTVSVTGSAGSVPGVGGNDNDALIGTAGADILLGGEGEDTISGNAGEDIIIGGLDYDILTGGGDEDTFVWTQMDDAVDSVTDFDASEGDKLELRDLFDDVSGTDMSALLDDFESGDFSGQVNSISLSITEGSGNSTLTINKDGQQLEVNFDGASAADIANSLISNLEQLRE